MTKYIVPVIAKEELQKKLEKLNKKAIAYGNHLEYSFGEEIVVTRNVYSVEGNEKVKTGEQKVFGVELTVESDIIRKDGYTVVAGIEHNGAGNIVNLFDENYPADLSWYTIQPYCEHCNTRHVKRYTYIVKDAAGNCKQVGKSCLKDYCGIDPQMIISAQEIGDLIETEYDIDEYDFCGCGEYAYDVLEVIATANDIIGEYGYVKSCEDNSTKSRLINGFGKIHPSEGSKKFASEMQEAFSRMEYRDLTDYQRNVKSLLQAQYVRSSSFGFLAYAPIAYKQMKKKQEQEQNRNQEKALSSYIGNVGERITAEIKDTKLVTSWETIYGMTWLYKFTTTDNNTLVWYASRYFDGKPSKITGTVKDHKDHDGEKQTVLTRCKVM